MDDIPKEVLDASAEEPKEREKKIATLETHANELLPKGLHIKPMAPDGNCLYSAIADQMNDAKQDAAYYRDLAMQTLGRVARKHDFFGPGDDITDEYVRIYISNHSENGKYGGEPELKALSEALSRKIVVYSVNKKGDLYNVTYGNGDPPLQLWYHGSAYQHYDSVKEDEAPLLSTAADPSSAAAASSGSVTLSPPADPDLALVASLLLSSSALALGQTQTQQAQQKGPTMLGRLVGAVSAVGSTGSRVIGRGAYTVATGMSAVGRGVGTGAYGVLGKVGQYVKGSPQQQLQPAGYVKLDRTKLSYAPRPEAFTGVSPGVEDAIKYLMREPPSIQAEGVITLDTKSKLDDVVSVYVIWDNKLLIHRRSASVPDSNTLSVPTSKITDTNISYEDEAIANLKKEANLDPAPEIKHLNRLSNTTEGDTRYVSFYVLYKPKPKVNGPNDDKKAKIDMTYDFATIKGEGMEVVASAESDPEPVASAPVPAASVGYKWATILDLRRWLADNKKFRNRLFYEQLRKLIKALGISMIVNDYASRDLPTWAAKWADTNKLAPLTDPCPGSDFVTADCIAKSVRKNIFIADEFAQDGHLSQRLNDPELLKYKSLVEKSKDVDRLIKGRAISDLEKDYRESEVFIRSAKDGTIHSQIVPNPYKAMKYREDDHTTFANPSGISNADPRGDMRKQNMQLLKELVPNEIIADKAMSIAILEALWFCGNSTSVNSDYRCFPLKLLAELREYHEDKKQQSQKAVAIDFLRQSDWVQVTKWLAALHQAMAGSDIYNMKELDFTKPKKPILVGDPAAVPASDPAPVPAPAAVPALAPAPQQVSLINPSQLGGLRVKPILPTRALGALPPLRRGV